MADYIDREKLLDCIDLLVGDDCKYSVFYSRDIKKIPAENDVVKVVRCKDCAYSKPNPRRENQRWCEAHMKMMYDDDFCSCGSSRGASNG